MSPLLPDEAAFAEERYLRRLFCSVLAHVCATKPTIPHVFVGMGFKFFVRDYRPGDGAAQEDAERVFKLLNDDGEHGPLANTAAGYLMSRAGRVFLQIRDEDTLKADLLDVPLDYPIDMVERFTHHVGGVDSPLAVASR